MSPFARLFALPVLATLALPAPGAAARLRPDGLLDDEGKAFFPLGLMDHGSWKYDDWQKRIRDAGVNCVWDWQMAYADSVPSCRAVVDSAIAGNYRLLIGSRDTIEWDDLSTPELEVSRPLYDADRLADLLECAATDPEVILGYTNRDEPSWMLARGWIGDIDAEEIRAAYDLLHATIPGTFVATNFAPVHLSADRGLWERDLVPFLPTTDVVMHAAYPYPAGPGTCQEWNVLGYPDCALDRLADNADLFLGDINLPGQPLWMIVQAHKGIPRREARWAAYASVIHGATGIFWAGWTWVHPLGDGEDNWDVIHPVIAEVASLHDFLAGRDVPGARASSPDVDVRARRHPDRDEVVLFAVSRRGFSGEATLVLPGALPGSAEVVKEGRAVPIAAGRIVDRFEPWEAHVYRYGARAVDGEPPAPPHRSGPFAVSAYPNPSPGPVRVLLTLPAEAAVVVTAYDAGGRRVALVGTGRYTAGRVELSWDGRGGRGQALPPGVYFVRAVSSAGDEATAKVLLER